MNYAINFYGREKNFFDEFEKLADKIDDACQVFIEILNNDHIDVNILRLRSLEQEADIITHSIISRMQSVYATPLQSSDIYKLADKMDGIIDLIDSAAERVEVYKMNLPANEMKDLALVLSTAICNLRRSVYSLREKKNHGIIMEKCGEMYELQRRANDVLCDSLMFLFENIRDAVELFKRKEIMEKIEKAIKLNLDVVLVLEGIVLKA